MNAQQGGSLSPHKRNGSKKSVFGPVTKKSLDRCAYTTQEAAEKLAVSTKTIRRWISRGLLPTSKACRKLLISARAVETFMEVTI